MTISVVAQYSDSSGFLNSLTPTVSVITPDGTSVSSGSATFIANGLYQYTFTVNYDVQYIWQFLNRVVLLVVLLQCVQVQILYVATH